MRDYTFSATAGQRVVLQVASVTNPIANVYLLKPDGTTQTSIQISNNPAGQLFFMDTQTLTTTGTYTLWVQHNSSNVGSETLQLTSVPGDFTAPITIGGAAVRVPSTGNTAVGQNASLSFTATAGQRVSVNISNGSYTPYYACHLTLKDPNGNVLTTGFCGNGANPYIDAVTLNTAGNYNIFVDPQVIAVGTTTVQLNNDSDLTGAIAIDGPPVAPTTALGQDARYTFSATAGQRVVLRITSVTNPVANVYLLKPDGTTQTSIQINNSPAGQLFFMDTQTLATTGTYTVWVQHNSSNVGSETLQLNSVPPDYAASLTQGVTTLVPATGNLAIGQNANLTFNASAGSEVSVQFNSSTMGLTTVNLLKPGGSMLGTLTSSSPSFSMTTMLPSSGTYTVFVNPAGTSSGSFSVLLTLVAASAPPSRSLGNGIDPSNPLSQNLAGLFVMNEATGTTDKNLVDGQLATFSGTNTPSWNATDPSVILNGTTTSLSSYLDAGADLNFDQLTSNKMTVVAKVFLNTMQGGGIAEKTDDIYCGFALGVDNTGAVTGYVSGFSPMYVRSGAAAVINGQWVQVAFTWDGTMNNAAATAAHIYVNGVEQPKVTSANGSGPCSSGSATNKSLRIGNASTGLSGMTGSLNGRIAYVAVYKYRVLSSAELGQLDAQLPITASAVGSITESGGAATVTTTSAGQNADVTFNGWANQQVMVQLSNNTMGAVNVSLIAPDGTTVTSGSSSSPSFNLPTTALPLTGTYDVLIQPTGGTTGSITVSLLVPDGRVTGSVVDPSNLLSQNLVGLFVMNEATGTTDKNLVDGQLATFAGTNTPNWNAADPSVILSGTTTSLSSYLDAGTDLNFDLLTSSRMTVVAKVFLNTMQGGGIAEKTDDVACGFAFGVDNTGALVGYVSGFSPMYVKSGAGAVVNGQWAQVAFTWDGTLNNMAATAAHIYLNGVEQTKAVSQNGSSACYTGTATNKSFRIGNASTGVSGMTGSLNGRIAYVAVYRGRVLSAGDLSQLDVQLPIDTVDVSGTLNPNGAASSATIANAGQNARLTFTATAGQNATVQLSNNTLGSTTVSLLNTDGTTLSSLTSASSSFTLPPAIVPYTGQYAVYVHPGGGTGSISAGVMLASVPSRPTTAVLDTNNPLATSLKGLFVMNEGTGTADTNLVDGQVANFSGAGAPTWNTSDPSVIFAGGASLNSYLNAGTDLAFDQLPTGQVTIIAKVYVSTAAAGGVCEKNDGGSVAGFSFGWDSTGALRLTVEKSSVAMSAITGANSIHAGGWTQVAFTWDGTVGTAAAAHLYVNAIEQTKVSSNDGSGTLTYANATNQPFRIGNTSVGNSGSLNGKIAYLAVYRGRILSTSEMSQLDAQLPIH